VIILMTRRTKVILGSVAGVVLAGAGFFAYAAYETIHVIVPNAYAVWWTADLVIDHMEKHQGAWPRSWEELRATSGHAYKGTVSTNLDGAMIAEFRPRASIEELQQRVEIDWTADPSQLVKADFKRSGPPFRVIWLRNGKSTHYSGKEPNAMILEFLKWKANQKAEPGGAGVRRQPLSPDTNPAPAATGPGR
jgi:hypothetical protein